MHCQVFISGLLLLLPAALASFTEVRGEAGYPVTLPCSYPATRILSFVCWGRGGCTSDKCGQMLFWTDGRRINYRANNRYQLKSPLLQGNASLTIESVAESDSGVYCCRVETKGWNGVQSLNVSLQVQPGSNLPVTKTKGFYAGISIALLLLLFVSTVVIAKYILMKKKPESPSLVAFCVSKMRTLRNTKVVQPRAQDNIYNIEDGPPVKG
ncbi:hepatitis A virus cellular receptor 1 homolog [Meriones unguiculatus]|uniref:hepatitis A virus cellular receptor 1 homolog n=1 Tax=Meriones unguiculatus TaxID=10047 RepID=UPI000B4F1E3A|nr:hepatitis A virus cellular receptor 1 homolog [Meriones unguiculatus]